LADDEEELEAMSRVITTQGPGRERQRQRRTIAEILRRLVQKPELDDEARDLAALIVFCLREIEGTVERATEAWENRNYYLRADQFRLQWAWAGQTADRLTDTLRKEQWDELPMILAQLLPHFADIRVIRMTRSPSVWQGAYARLLDDDQA
jgi:hypothetical protein